MTFSLRSLKPSKWALPNKGVQARAARDVEQEVLDRRTVESTRAVLERKAKIYEKLKKGQSGGLSEAQFDSLLVDVRFPPNPLPWCTSVTDCSSLTRNRTILTNPTAMMSTSH